MNIAIKIFAVIGFLVTCGSLGCLLSYCFGPNKEYEEWKDDESGK